MSPRNKRPRPVDQLFLVTQSHYDRLVENVIAGAQPPVHIACDWLSDSMAHGIQVFPVRTYEILRELANGTSSNR